MTVTAEGDPGVSAVGQSVFEIFSGFLVAQRLDLYPPRELAPGVMALLADDDGLLVNCYVTYEPPPETTSVNLVHLLREARIDPARTDIVIPDHWAEPGYLAQFRRVMQGHVHKVHALSGCLDGFLRPEAVCLELAGPAADGTPGHPAWRSDRPPLYEQALLSEKDWVPQDAIVPGQGQIPAQSYLHTYWARGHSPRLCIVVAPAGHGKSKVTHILARRLAEAYRSAPYGHRPPLPILIPFGKYRRGTSNFDGLVLRVISSFGVARLTAEAFRYLVSLGRVLFILDGYDEMVEADPDQAADNITEFVRNAGPRSRILLTTRSTFYRTSTDVVGKIADPLLTEAEVEVIDLQPFSRPQAREYIRKRLAESPYRSRAMERAQQMIDEEWNPDILGSPIFLAEFISDLTRDKWSITDVRASGFLEFLIERAFDRERNRQDHDFSDDQQREYLESIAFDLLTTDSLGYSRDDLEVFAYEVANEEQRERQNWLTLWNGLANHYFLLPDDDEKVQAVATMRHQVWREYFQGCALAARINAGDKAAIGTLATRDLPEGVLRTADLRLSERAWSSLVERLPASGDKLVRNMLRMALLRPVPDGEKLRVSPEIGRHLAGRDLSETVFRDVVFHGSLAGANLAGCFFEGCDLSGASFDRTMLIRTDFRDCRLPANDFADADVSSLTIDGEAFFGPQLSARRATAEGTHGPAAAEAPDRVSVRQWVIDILRARLSKFTKARAGEPHAILDTSISWNAFIGGTALRDRDFVVRPLYRALRAENVVADAPTGMTTRPTVFLSRDPEVGSEVLSFVRDGAVGPVLERVIARVVK